MQLLKTGADAVSAAVRIARTYTGREHVIACGYLGWHDWASEEAGVPVAVGAATRHVLFDDVETLERAVSEAGDDLAAIVLEPVVERLPSDAWLQRARALCDDRGAALVFDEIKTGFRIAPGGYQEVSGVTPDLATFGKALANGYPLSAVVGHAALMDAAHRTWISSTLASESTALAAALAVLDWHEEADICATLAETGREMRAAVDRAIAASGVAGVFTSGIDPMFLLMWDDPHREARFLAECARAGVHRQARRVQLRRGGTRRRGDSQDRVGDEQRARRPRGVGALALMAVRPADAARTSLDASGASAPSDATRRLLLIDCPDEVGLVHRITGVLFRAGFSVVSNHEYVDPARRHFFMRTEFVGDRPTDTIIGELRHDLPRGRTCASPRPNRVASSCSRRRSRTAWATFCCGTPRGTSLHTSRR